MINRILKLAVKDGLPVVPGADWVTPANSGKLHVAYGPKVRGINTDWMHALHAFLFEVEPGLYAVFAEKEAMTIIDPTGIGKCMPDWSKTAEFSKWPNTDGWRKKDAQGHLTAAPTVPCSCGSEDLPTILDKAEVAANEEEDGKLGGGE